MTEMSPLGTVGALRAKHAGLPDDGQLAIQLKQGRAICSGSR